jgi:hypothetical protein
MAKARKRTGAGKVASKRRKAGGKTTPKKVARRVAPKKAKAKVQRAIKTSSKSSARKRPLPKAAEKTTKVAAEMPVVETTVIDVIEEPVPGVLMVTEFETTTVMVPSEGAAERKEEPAREPEKKSVP